MLGRRSISVEPENIASPRRSSRILKVIHQDSPIPAPATKTTEKVPIRRTRRSSSTQEKSLSDIQKDVKAAKEKKLDEDDSKTPIRRTRRSVSAQPETPKEINSKTRKSTTVKPIVEDEDQQEEKTPPNDAENKGGRPKRRVTRSMSKSPVSLQNSKPTPAVATRSRRTSLNEKQPSDSKVLTLDIIKENESEQEKIDETHNNTPPETNETDVLNNNKKQKTEIVQQTSDIEDTKLEASVSNKNDETETMDNQGIQDNQEDEAKSHTSLIEPDEKKDTLNISNKSIAASSPKIKDNSNISKTQINEEEQLQEDVALNVSQEKKDSEVIENNVQKENITEKTEVDNSNNTIKMIKSTKKEEIEDISDKLNNSNISVVSNISVKLNSSVVDDYLKKQLQNDEMPQNISLVNDDGRSYSPIIPKVENISIRLNESIKSLNSTSTPKRLNVSTRSNSENMESLHLSTKGEDEDIKVNDKSNHSIDVLSKSLDSSIKSVKNTPTKSIVNDSITSLKSLDSGKKLNKSTPIRTTDNKENDDMNKLSSEKKSSSKKVSMDQRREEMLDAYIATFTAEKKRKRDSMNSSVNETASTENKKRRSSKIFSCNFSDDEDDEERKSPKLKKKEYESEDDSNEKTKNEFIDDSVSVGSEDTPSIDSNEIIDEGESVGSSVSDIDSDDTYENDSFVVDDDVGDADLLSGDEDFLGTNSKPKRKRIMQFDSDSEDEEKDEFEKMSMEAFGGLSPSMMSEKQISSNDSDMESIKNRNEQLSKQIEEGTNLPEVEEPKNVESESDNDAVAVAAAADAAAAVAASDDEDDICIIEDNKEESDSENSSSLNISVELQEKKDVQTAEEDVAPEIKSNDVTEKKSESEDSISGNDDAEEMEKNCEIDETIYNPFDEQKVQEEKESLQEEETENKTENETESLQEEESTVSENVDEKETKYKKLLEKYFNVTKNRSRRQSTGEEIASKTPSKPLRRISLGIDLEKSTKDESFKKLDQTNKTKIIEVDIKSKTSSITETESNAKYEYNTSGVYRVSPLQTEKSSQIQLQDENDDALLMLQDFNNSLNESQDLNLSKKKIKSKKKSMSPKKSISENNDTYIVEKEIHTQSPVKSSENDSDHLTSEKKKRKKQNKMKVNDSTPVKSSEESDTHTNSSKKKRKMMQLDDSINKCEEEIATKSSDNSNETLSAKKKRKKQNTISTPVKSSEESNYSNTSSVEFKQKKIHLDVSMNQDDEVNKNKACKKIKRKLETEENSLKTNKIIKKKNRNKMQSASDTEKTSTDSEKEHTTIKRNKKKKSPKNMFNFKVVDGKLSPSKSETVYENYVPVRHRNVFKNLIKPSSCGFSGTNQFVIKDLVSKVSHGIKKQKFNNNKSIKASISGMVNCANWKEKLLDDGIVKTVKISKKTAYNHPK